MTIIPFESEIEIIKIAMLSNPNQMFVAWTIGFCKDRIFKTPFRNKSPNESTPEYVSQFIDYLTGYLICSDSSQRSKNKTIISIYIKK